MVICIEHREVIKGVLNNSKAEKKRQKSIAVIPIEDVILTCCPALQTCIESTLQVTTYKVYLFYDIDTVFYETGILYCSIHKYIVHILLESSVHPMGFSPHQGKNKTLFFNRQLVSLCASTSASIPKAQREGAFRKSWHSKIFLQQHTYLTHYY